MLRFRDIGSKESFTLSGLVPWSTRHCLKMMKEDPFKLTTSFIYGFIDCRAAPLSSAHRVPGVRYLTGLSGILALSLSSIKVIVIPDNACVNSSIFCDTGTASVR